MRKSQIAERLAKAEADYLNAKLELQTVLDQRNRLAVSAVEINTAFALSDEAALEEAIRESVALVHLCEDYDRHASSRSPR